MDKLTKDFERSIFNKSKEIIGDYLEVGVDSFINNGVLKDIPIVNTIVSVLKIGQNLHDRNLLKQSLVFINEFNNNCIDEEQLNAYRKKLESDEKVCEKELGRVLLLLNYFIDKEKSVYLAKLFKAYVSETISWNEFCEYSEVINRLFVQDVKLLHDIYMSNKIMLDEFAFQYELSRIESLGLIKLNPKSSFSYGEVVLDDFTIGKTLIGEKITGIIL